MTKLKLHLPHQFMRNLVFIKLLGNNFNYKFSQVTKSFFCPTFKNNPKLNSTIHTHILKKLPYIQNCFLIK